MTRPRFRLLTCWGLGYLPASGTWGSMPPVALALVLIIVGLSPAQHPIIFNAIMLAIVLVFSHICVHQGDMGEAWFAKKDPGEVVADEVAGQALVLMFLPLATPHTPEQWLQVLAILACAFLAFRLFDILKLPPANALQSLPAGWGILVDDMVMAIPAWLVTQGVAWMVLS